MTQSPAQIERTSAEQRFVAQMSSTLDTLSIQHGELRRLNVRVWGGWSDGERVVIKIRGGDSDSYWSAAQDYLDYLQRMEAPGVRCEPRLCPEPVEVAPGVWAAVIGWVPSDCEPDEAPQSVPPKELGAYVRAVHDALSAGNARLRAGSVMCPDDWKWRNMVVSGGQPVIVDLDNTHAAPRELQVKLAALDLLEHLSGPRHEKALKEFMEGYGPF